jgi:beta-galactosidase
MEHRGEAMWLRICTTSGALDLYLIKKDAFYLNQSHFSDQPMIHMLPHWNHRGREGEEFRVIAYSNCPEMELFVNGVSQGKQIPDPYGHGEWIVPFEAGKLRAVGYRDGKALAEETVETSSAPVKLELSLQTDPRTAQDDCAVLHCTCVDAKGRPVPDAAPTVEFFCTGGGSILGTGSDHTDHTPPACEIRRMYAGVIAVAVRITSDAPIRVFARADGLTQAVLEI